MFLRQRFSLSKRHCFEWQCLCGGLNENVLHRLAYLNSCSPVSSFVGRDYGIFERWSFAGGSTSLEGEPLLEEVRHRRWSFTRGSTSLEVSFAGGSVCSTGVTASCLYLRMWLLNFFLLVPCLPFAVMYPWRDGFLLCWNWAQINPTFHRLMVFYHSHQKSN